MKLFYTIIMACPLVSCNNNSDTRKKEVETPISFDYRSTNKLLVDININTTEEAILNICSMSEGKINFKDCILKTRLINGKYKKELLISDGSKDITASIAFVSYIRPTITQKVKVSGKHLKIIIKR